MKTPKVLHAAIIPSCTKHLSCIPTTKMTRQRPLWQYILLFLSFLSFSLAACKSIPPCTELLLLSYHSYSPSAAPTSFCKCTCNTNSTIIPLDAPPSADKPTAPSTSSKRLFLRDEPQLGLALSPRDILPTDGAENRVHGRTCADCNKQFCLSYNLPICAGVKEENVFTTCFQRDSVKDQLVVWIFIVATLGLLTWATVKPWWTRWREGYRAVPAG